VRFRVVLHCVIQVMCLFKLTKFTIVCVLFTYYKMNDGRFEIILLSVSYLIRNCLNVYNLSLDKVTVTLDVLVSLLKVDYLLQCEYILLDISVQEGDLCTLTILDLLYSPYVLLQK
jgi:hypothetical protein